MRHLRYACMVQALALILLSFDCLSAGGTPAAAQELEEVVVTASPIGDPDALATIAGSVDRNQILRNGGNLADALADLPGVTGSGFAAGASRPVIRGFDANRVRVLEDGVGSFDVSDIGPDHGVPIDPLAAERIEVVRGAATLRYGSQAIGGVVNAINNRVPAHMPEDPFSGEVAAGYSTGADARDAAGQINAGIGQFALHADGFARHSGDYDTPQGVLDNSFVNGGGAALGGSWIHDDDHVGLGVVRYQSRYGIPGEDSHIEMEQTKLLLRSAIAVQGSALKLVTIDGGWADYSHDELDADGIALATFLDREWDLRGEATLGRLGLLSETAVGMQLQHRNFSALGEGRGYLEPTETRTEALFGFTEAALGDALRLQLGARVEQVDVDGTPISGTPVSRGFTPVSASTGLVFDASDALRFGLSLSTAARAPAQTELFARGAHDGPATFEIGDPDLTTERANSVEVSLRWRSGRLHADGSVWSTHFSDFIYGALTGRTCNEEGQCQAGDAGDFRELVYTQGSARYTGAEAHADLSLTRIGSGELELNLMGDAVRARLGGGAGDVPRIPPWHLGAGLSWQSEAFDASVRLKYAGRQDHFGAFDTPTAGFANLDAQFGWRPWSDRKGVELALVGHNLTDRAQRNAVSFNKDDILMPGRDIRLMIRASFK